MGVSIPIKLLNEAQGHIVSLELTSGIGYRGKLMEAEDNMNVQLKDVIITGKDGAVRHSDRLFIRGSQIQFFSVPEILKDAPMFNTNPSKPPAPIRGKKN